MITRFLLLVIGIIFFYIGSLKLIILLVVGFIIYKTGFHKILYENINKFINRNNQYNHSVKERKKFIKHFRKQQKINQEI